MTAPAMSLGRKLCPLNGIEVVHNEALIKLNNINFEDKLIDIDEQQSQTTHYHQSV